MTEDHRPRLRSPEEAAALVRDRDDILLAATSASGSRS